MEGGYSIRVALLCWPSFNQFDRFRDERNIQVIELCDEVIEKDPEFVGVYVLKYKCLFSVCLEANYKSRRNEMEASFHELSELAYRLDPKNPDAVSNYSNSFKMNGDYEQRVKYAKEALDLNPSHPRSNSQYWMSICNEGRFADAEKFFLRAIELDPVQR
jgi:tetratricopeptide (TPR) repeat protein